ncbi:MAG: methyltransferase [Oceanospirillaceae bacterium]|nr:methyltransferase [Oceanospirillaceae bacterium]MCP5350040.1 methyltransferase [Oceanospirillaceae bacterium]
MAKQSEFQCKNFSIAQNDCAMKITLDACLFASGIHFQNPERLLDIGSGTGLLSLFLAQRYANTNIHAIELDPAASAQCAQNFERSPYHTRLQCECGDIRELQGQTFDAIVCNPPFFTSGISSSDPKRAQARHAYGLPLADLLNAIERLLSQDGECWLLLSTDALSELKNLLKGGALHLKHCIDLQARADKPIHRHFVLLSRQTMQSTRSSLCAYADGTRYTEQARTLLQDFFIRL